MNEKKILASIVQDRANYDLIADHVDTKEFSPEVRLIYEEVAEYYESDHKCGHADTEILVARLERKLPDPKHAKRCVGVLNALPDVSGTNVVRELLAVKAGTAGLELASSIAAGKQDKALAERYLSLLSLEALDTPNEEVQGLQVADLVAKRLDDKELIQIAPRELNSRLDGGARPGHHVLVYAPTEMGKTLFVINMVAHFLRQGLRTLYVGNEDPAEDILLRLFSRISGMDKFQIRDDPTKAQALLDAAGYGNFVFADLSPGSFPRIERLVKKYEPKVVVLDQLSNLDVSVSKSESKTGSLEVAAKNARALAKRHRLLCVSVSQAADSATGKIVLGRGDVHNSNIGIPGQVDLMVGIGADEAMESRGLRELTLVKNKISGNHDHFTVRFNPILSKVEG